MSALTQATWTDLRGTDLITYSTASANRLLIDHQLARKRIDVRGRFEVEHLSAAIGLVSAGVGAAILPSSSLLAEAYPGLRQIPLVNPVIKRSIGLIRRRATSLSPAARALFDLLAEELRRSISLKSPVSEAGKRAKSRNGVRMKSQPAR